MTRTIQTDLDEKYLELRQRQYLKDLAAQERRNRMIAENEAARVARGEAKQPPYVFPSNWDAYKARAAYLMTKYAEDEAARVARINFNQPPDWNAYYKARAAKHAVKRTTGK
jgi:hypothetical protein